MEQYKIDASIDVHIIMAVFKMQPHRLVLLKKDHALHTWYETTPCVIERGNSIHH